MERSEKKNINGKAHRVQGAGSVDVLPSGKHRVRVKVKGRRVADVFATAEEAEALRQCPADTASWRLAVAVLDGGPLRARRAVMPRDNVFLPSHA